MGIEGMRHHYIEYRVQRYLLEHPDVLESKARKYAKVAWRNKVKRWEQRGLFIKDKGVVNEPNRPS